MQFAFWKRHWSRRGGDDLGCLKVEFALPRPCLCYLCVFLSQASMIRTVQRTIMKARFGKSRAMAPPESRRRQVAEELARMEEEVRLSKGSKGSVREPEAKELDEFDAPDSPDLEEMLRAVPRGAGCNCVDTPFIVHAPDM